MVFRAFISVDFKASDTMLEFCDELRRTDAALKVVRPELLHLTLKFLGDIQESAVPWVVEVIGSSVSGVEPMEAIFRGVGAFPGLSNIGVVWIGLEGADGLRVIAERLEKDLSQLGFRREKRGFRPHLTVARSKGSRGMSRVREVIERWEGTSFGSQAVEEIRLKKSILGPTGPSYHTVERVPLRPMD